MKKQQLITLFVAVFLKTGFLINAQGFGQYVNQETIASQVEVLKKINAKEHVCTAQKVKFRAFPKGNVSSLKTELESVGATKCKVYGSYLTGWIDLDKMDSITELKSLKMIRPVDKGNSASALSGQPFKPGIVTGVTATQGDKAMLTDVFRNTNKVLGCGVKIGVISNSYNILKGAEKGVENGDLPGVNNPNGFTSPVTVLQEAPPGFDAGFATDEGRAMIEIIHDIAPGAEIFFYSAEFGIEDFANGFRVLADAGVDIIVDDIFYFAEPYFQEGIVTQAIDEVSDRGVSVFTVNGNIETTNSYQSEFVRTVIKTNNSGGTSSVHNFNRGVVDFNFNGFEVSNAPVLPINIRKNKTTSIVLQWDQPSIFANPNGPKPATNLGIIVLEEDANNPNINVITDFFFSRARETGDPFMDIILRGGNNGINFKLVVFIVSGPTPKNIKIFDPVGSVTIDEQIDDPTAFFHAGTQKGIAVGAVRFGDTPVFGSPLIPDPFNLALGGQKLLLDRDGNRIENPTVINKPDIMAVDVVNTSFFGRDVGGSLDPDPFPNFFGTSAAAPHAAAATALILEAYKKSSSRKLTPVQIKDALLTTATDMLEEGFDFKSGNGFIDTQAALDKLLLVNCEAAPTGLTFVSSTIGSITVKFDQKEEGIDNRLFKVTAYPEGTFSENGNLPNGFNPSAFSVGNTATIHGLRSNTTYDIVINSKCFPATSPGVKITASTKGNTNFNDFSRFGRFGNKSLEVSNGNGLIVKFINTSKTINIVSNDTSKVDLEIRDLLGKVVWSSSTFNSIVNIPELASGTYILLAKQKGTSKIIKIGV